MSTWSLEKTLDWWRRGVLTRIEAMTRLLEGLQPDNLHAFLKAVPTDILEELKALVQGCPVTEKEWHNSKRYYIGSGRNSQNFVEPWNEAMKSYRMGVETLRKHYANNEKP